MSVSYKRNIVSVYIDRLYKEYGYPPENIKTDVHVFLDSRSRSADVVIFEGNKPLIVVEVKTKTRNIVIEETQLGAYCAFLGCKYAVLTNGHQDTCFKVEHAEAGTKLIQISDIPLFSGRSGVYYQTPSQLKEILLSLFEEADNTNQHKFSAMRGELFLEFLKILVTKVYDERNIAGSYFKAITDEHPMNIRSRIESLYHAADKDSGYIFRDATIELSEDIVSFLVYRLQKYSLIKSGIETIDIVESLIQQYNLRYGVRSARISTPLPIAEFMASLGNPSKKDRVLDLSCNIGTLVKAAAKRGAEAIGIEKRGLEFQLAKANLYLAGIKNYQIYHTDTLLPIDRLRTLAKEAIQGSAFDLIVSHPPFGLEPSTEVLDYYRMGGIAMNTKSSEILFIEQSLNLLRPGGKLILWIPDRLLANEKLSYARQFILRYFRVLSVISLAEDVLVPYVRISSSIVVLEKREHEQTMPQDELFLVANARIASRGTTNYEDILSPILDAFRRFVGGDTSIRGEYYYAAKIADNLRLDPTYYIHQRNIGKSKYPVAKLSDLVIIKPGIRPTRLGNSGKKFRLVKAHNIANLKVNLWNSESINCDERLAEPYLIHPNAILVTRAGTVGNVGVFTYSDTPAIFSDNLFRLSPKKPDIDLYYLLAFLTSELGQLQIKQQTAGTAIKAISASALANIEVPIIPIDQQKKIAKDILHTFEVEDKISKLWNEYNRQRGRISKYFGTVSDLPDVNHSASEDSICPDCGDVHDNESCPKGATKIKRG